LQATAFRCVCSQSLAFFKTLACPPGFFVCSPIAPISAKRRFQLYELLEAASDADEKEFLWAELESLHYE
jgi:hypothetical protein